MSIYYGTLVIPTDTHFNVVAYILLLRGEHSISISRQNVIKASINTLQTVCVAATANRDCNSSCCDDDSNTKHLTVGQDVFNAFKSIYYTFTSETKGT